jgi:hypothetical protein
MARCEICGDTCADDPKALGRHLWERHRITPNDYRVRYLGTSPKCSRPGCNKPVPRSTSGGWFKCCSPSCAIQMGEDIPLRF